MLCVCVCAISIERSGRREIKKNWFLMSLEGHCENDVTRKKISGFE